MDANTSIILGRLATDPQMKGYKKRDGTDGYRTFFRVAVTHPADLGRPRDERRTDFIPVTCWGRLAQVCAEHLAKGTEVFIQGRYRCTSQAIADTNPVQYREFHGLEAIIVQFGRRSMKNQAAQAGSGNAASALEERVAAAGAGTPGASLTGGENPFEQAAS